MPWPPQIYWIEAPAVGRLAVVSRPRDTEAFRLMKAGGIDILVSLQDPDEAATVGLGGQALQCANVGISFVSHPITDHGIPASATDFEDLVTRLHGRVAAGESLAAHCYAGLGRSPLLVAAILIRAGLSSDDAIDRVSQARGAYVPEMSTQHDWLHDYASRITR